MPYRAFADMRAVKAALQGSLDAAAEVGERVAQQPGGAVLNGFGECASVCCDDWRAAQLRLDVHAAERLEVR